MPRTPRAARTLTTQVRERLNRKADSKVGRETSAPDVNSLDGFGVYRTFIFDPTASKGLTELLRQVDDKRIAYVDEVEGRAIVHFSPTTIADDDTPFALDAAAEVLAASTD